MFAASKTAAPVSAAKYIEDVFSVWLRTGTGANATITTNLDASTNKSLVWTKSRSAATDHKFTDTVRGATKALISNTTGAETTDTTGLTAFSSTGYTIGTSTTYNNSGATYVDWQFVAAPKFFDVVTYTGNNAGQTLNHNLGSTPGFIYVKCRSAAGEIGAVYHRSLGASKYLVMEQTAAAQDSTGFWGTPTSTTFFVPSSMSANGATYVAYLFAHDAGGFGAAGTDNVISCGSYTGNGSATAGPTVTLGYEPQFLLVKSSSTTGNWKLEDNMRGLSLTRDAYLNANTTAAEVAYTANTGFQPNATGFQVNTTDSSANTSGQTYIYIAIRRGPMRTPTSGTSVFNSIAQSGSSNVNVGFPVDFVLTRETGSVKNTSDIDRLRGYNNVLRTNLTNAEATGGVAGEIGINAAQNSYTDSLNGANASIYWNFRRAPGFFDVVCYTGNATNRTVNHNLGVAPELMIIKSRSAATDWRIYSAAIGAGSSGTLDTGSFSANGALYWNSTAPTSTVFTLGSGGNINANAATFVAYLFATVAGVSKVGSYTGTGTTKQIDCGFAAGARFVLIKRTDSTGDWYVWDSARGIVAGNDPYLLLNSTAAEVTNTDYVDTYSAGFDISSTAPAAINANGGTFIFLAIS